MAALVLDHLWQSTVLALGLGLLTLAFRRAPASVRHGLWLAASVKFLVPFAALAALGGLIGPAIALSAAAASQEVLLKQAAEPFSQSVLARSAIVRPSALPPASPPADFPFAHGPDSSASLVAVHPAVAPAVHAALRLDLILQFVPSAILVVWVLGSAAIAVAWIRRWTRLRTVMRSARPLPWVAPMPVLAAPALVEPGLMGLWRPVLLLPETLPDHLSQAETAAIIAHEACHLRRRDNLTAALHMVVEALFWFHPLVWWIGGRLIAERERACDEAVVGAGHDRAVYARSLVQSCRLYLQSPLDCVAGASGSNLKTRVEAIMTAPPSSPLSRTAKALLLTAGVCALATPVAAGLLTAPATRKAVARAAAVAARMAPVPVTALDGQTSRAESAPDEGRPAKPVVLAQNDPAPAPGLSIARLEAINGPPAQDLAAPRVDQAQATARPGTEDAVRNWILALQTHQPALARLSPAVEQAARPQWPITEQMFRSFGALKAVRFLQVTPGGDDAYEADFTHAKIQVIVAPLTADGELSRLAWGPLWTQAGRGPAPQMPLSPNGMQAPLYRWGSPAPGAVGASAGPGAGPISFSIEEAPPARPIPPASLARLPLTPVASAAAPADVKQAASAFLQSYGDAFWNTDDLICVRVEGLPSDKAAAVKARVEADARAAGVSVGRAECSLHYQIEIRFAADPERAVNDVLDFYRHPLWPFPMEKPTGADRPIRAWYGIVYDFAGGAGGGRNLGSHPNARRKLDLAIVVVDPARTRDMSLDTVSDYVAMLALSQPRALDHCNVLPSITDLFAGGCPNRATPTALTAADAAYLKALYTGSPGIRATRTPSELVDRIAKLLGGDRVAAL